MYDELKKYLCVKRSGREQLQVTDNKTLAGELCTFFKV